MQSARTPACVRVCVVVVRRLRLQWDSVVKGMVRGCVCTWRVKYFMKRSKQHRQQLQQHLSTAKILLALPFILDLRLMYSTTARI